MYWKEKALLQALEEYPKESCGLLLNVKGKHKYYSCKNIATTVHQCFIIAPEDYIKANNLGDIIGVVHSHPKIPPTPSEADKIGCEQSNLPWHIINPITEQWGYYQPCGYKPKLLGRPYVWGVTDCYSLVKDYYKQELNIVLKDWDRPVTLEDFEKDPMFERCAWRTGFRKLRDDEKLQKNDLIFFSIFKKEVNHIGLFLGEEIIHHLTDRLSCKESYSPFLLECTKGRYRYVA